MSEIEETLPSPSTLDFLRRTNRHRPLSCDHFFGNDTFVIFDLFAHITLHVNRASSLKYIIKNDLVNQHGHELRSNNHRHRI